MTLSPYEVQQLPEWRKETAPPPNLSWHGIPVMRMACEIEPSSFEELQDIACAVRECLRS